MAPGFYYVLALQLKEVAIQVVSAVMARHTRLQITTLPAVNLN
jgi:hypothetical protein